MRERPKFKKPPRCLTRTNSLTVPFEALLFFLADIFPTSSEFSANWFHPIFTMFSMFFPNFPTISHHFPRLFPGPQRIRQVSWVPSASWSSWPRPSTGTPHCEIPKRPWRIWGEDRRRSWTTRSGSAFGGFGGLGGFRDGVGDGVGEGFRI